MVDCAQNHSECPKILETRLPRRLLDVRAQEDKIRIVELPNQVGSYVALSYCWGKAQQIMATTKTITDFMSRGIEVKQLPQTLQDAITVTQNLNQQYLWIDALCILQDSEQDRITEIINMHNIYRHSMLTIYALSPTSCHEGFLKDHSVDGPRLINLPVALADGSHGVVLLRRNLHVSFERPPLTSRGWTLQESHLSPRKLLFGTMLSWECATIDGETQPLGLEQPQGQYRFKSASMERQAQVSYEKTVLKMRALPNIQERFVELFSEKNIEIQSQWAALIKDYAPRNLSVQSDKLPAIGGIATILGETSGFHYCAGFWRETLVFDLLWQVNRRDPRFLPPYRGPSWSWVAVDGEVNGYDLKRALSNSSDLCFDVLLDIISYKIIPKSPRATFGEVSSATLTLKAHVWGPFQYVGAHSFGGYCFELPNLSADYYEKAARYDTFFLSVEAYLDSLDIISRFRPLDDLTRPVGRDSVVRRKDQQDNYLYVLPILILNSSKARGLMIDKVSGSTYRRVGYCDIRSEVLKQPECSLESQKTIINVI